MVRDSHKIAIKCNSLENPVFNCDREFKFKSETILQSEADMLSGITMNNHKWKIHVCSSTVVNCANYLSPKTTQPIFFFKSVSQPIFPKYGAYFICPLLTPLHSKFKCYTPSQG